MFFSMTNQVIFITMRCLLNKESKQMIMSYMEITTMKENDNLMLMYKLTHINYNTIDKAYKSNSIYVYVPLIYDNNNSIGRMINII